MYNSTISMSIHTPTSTNEYLNIAKNYPNATIFAGGTYLMQDDNFLYENKVRDVIYIEGIPELKRITRNEEYIEIGSLVTLSKLLVSAKNILPKLLVETLKGVSTEIVRNKATIGGAICTKDYRFTLCAALTALHAVVEVRRPNNKKNTVEWMPITNLYTSTGFALKKNELVTRIRLSFDQGNFQYYKTIGNIIEDKENSLQFAFHGTLIQNKLTQSSFCFNFPTRGTFVLHDMQNVLNNSIFPFQPSNITKHSNMMIDMLKQRNSSINELCIELSKRVFEECLVQLNLFSLNQNID